MAIPTLLKQYREEIVPVLKEKLGRANVHSLPQIEKVVISMGIGSASQDRKRLVEVADHMTLLAGQKSQVTRARKSVAGFKLREGQEIGCRVTLRGTRMYEFLERLISLALPRVRDFRGVNPKAFDGAGNYSLGLNEQMVFLEIDPDSVHYTQGMNITIVTSAANNEEGFLLLKEFGMPFRK